VLHRWWYGGWTPYATGDHFVAGELSAVGSDPDYLGRSRRLLGLATDRGFGLAAWQPAFLLAVPALATLARRRPAGWAALALPLAAGWLVATFLALTMHGWWFPGRQVVVVLPLAALAVACWAGTGRRRRKELAHHQDHGTPEGDQVGRHGDARAPLVVAAGGGVGVVAYAWLVVDGLAGRVTWAVDFFATRDPAYRAWRLVLPDYLAVTTATWVLHAAWLVVLAAWAAAAWRRRRRAREAASAVAAGRMAGWTTPSPPA